MSGITTTVVAGTGLVTTVAQNGQSQTVVSASFIAPVVTVNTGLKGDRGLTGAAGATDLVVIAQQAFGGDRVLVSIAGQLQYADCMNPDHFGKVVGVTLGAVAQGDELTVRTIGMIYDDAYDAYPADTILRVGTNGLLVSEVPEGAAFAQVVGRILSPGHIWVRPRPGIRLTT